MNHGSIAMSYSLRPWLFGTLQIHNVEGKVFHCPTTTHALNFGYTSMLFSMVYGVHVSPRCNTVDVKQPLKEEKGKDVHGLLLYMTTKRDHDDWNR